MIGCGCSDGGQKQSLSGYQLNLTRLPIGHGRSVVRMRLGPCGIGRLALGFLIGRRGEVGVNLNSGEQTVAEAFGCLPVCVDPGCQNVFSQGAPEKIQ